MQKSPNNVKRCRKEIYLKLLYIIHTVYMQIAHTIHQEKNWMKLNGNVEQLVWKWSYLKKWNRQFKVKEEANFRKKVEFLFQLIFILVWRQSTICWIVSLKLSLSQSVTDGRTDRRTEDRHFVPFVQDLIHIP